jgi:hypothetical protein
MKDITGRRVKLKRSAKRRLGREHYNEFVGQIGTARPFEYPPGNRWPEWEVFWDCGLKYLYKREQLDLV